MNTMKAALSCLLLSAIVPAFATPLLIDFENDASGTPVMMSNLGYVNKNGGNNDVGNSDTANDDITFSANNVWLLGSQKVFTKSSTVGLFYGTTASTPTDPGLLTNKGALFLTADPFPPKGTTPKTVTSFTINVANGFNGAFSLAFAGEGTASIIPLDKQGNAITTTVLPDATGTETFCGSFACSWTTLSFDLGAATNVFGIEVVGTQNQQFFDNLNFANLLGSPSDNGNGNVPEPGGIALSAAALGALVLTRRRVAGRVVKR